MDASILNAIEKDKVCAIIPARAGSKGVKNKNIRTLLGYPMIAYAIAASKMAKGVDRIIVSTDSEGYAEIARYYGAETPFLRPAEIAGDNSTDIEFMEHAINWLYQNEGKVPEYFLHMRPTYPMREVNVVEEAIVRMKADASATSLRSAHLASNTPYKWFNLREDGYYKSIRDDLTLDEANNPRQAFEDVYIPDGYVDVLRTSFIVNNDLMHGDKMIGYVVPGGVDVDAMKDLEYLEYYIAGHSCEVVKYLQENYKKLEDWRS
ncbi:MAG: acylneuraminate cytidylyltransferase family protein [Lachnospiraceae bacterium]|nr:acylneuraminate cytidylyltransferase family protein [Lachnospiraceae bacterium]